MRIALTLWRNEWTSLFADAQAHKFPASPSYYVGLAILMLLIVVACVKAFQMWNEIHEVDEPDSPADLLQAFQEARAAGELDDEEFERVRRQLTGGTSARDKPSGPNDGGPKKSGN